MYEEVCMKPEEVFEELNDRQIFTHDFADLQCVKYVPLFIYHSDLLRSGKQNNLLHQYDNRYLGSAISVHDRYVLKHDNKFYNPQSVLFDVTESSVWKPNYSQWGDPNKAYIIGEVYAVSPLTIFSLDRYFSNGWKFERVKKTFTLREQKAPFKEVSNPLYHCHVYMGIPNYWDNITLYKRSQIKFLDKFIWANRSFNDN